MEQQLPKDKVSAEELMNNFVHVEFKHFVDADYSGTERSRDETKNGYLIYNAHRQDFGFGSFHTSDDYTIDSDVLDFVKARHPDFLPYITETHGLYVDGAWHSVEDDVIH